MKFLKYLLILLLLLVGFFFVKGLMTPSISYESKITVDKSAREAWNVMSDESKLPEWLSGFKSTELISGTKNTVGAKSKVTMEENGQVTEMTETIVKVIEDKLFAMNFTTDFMDMDYEMHFEEQGGKTVLTSKTTSYGNSLVAKSIIAFIKGSMKSIEDENMHKLKNVINSNTKVYN